MKKVFLLICVVLTVSVTMAQTKKVAILEVVDKEENISYANKLFLRNTLAKAIIALPEYEAVDRTDLDAILGEQNFQRTGLVTKDQIKQLGRMNGADYVLVAEAAMMDANNMYISAKLLDVETALSEISDYQIMGTSVADIQRGCEQLAVKLMKPIEANNKNGKKSGVNVIKAESDVEFARKKVEENRKYDKTYAEFRTYSWKKTDIAAVRFYMEQYENTMYAGNMLWLTPPMVALGVGMGVGLANEIYKELKLPIILGAIGASMLPSIICYCAAAGYRKKAWKEYRRPYDDAVKELEKARKYQQRASLQLSPTISYGYAGLALKLNIY